MMKFSFVSSRILGRIIMSMGICLLGYNEMLLFMFTSQAFVSDRDLII